jgi:hypothetical protein
VAQRYAPARTSLREYAAGADWSGFTSAVSLHAHTHHSREVMADLPSYISQIPVVAALFARELRERRRTEGDVDFTKGWWHPPLSPRAVFESEEKHIEARFALGSLVSVTDHDDIDAGVELQQRYAVRRAPISLEWTVPYGHGYFHLGVHNLPPQDARAWFRRLSAFTSGMGLDTLRDLLLDLHRLDGVLIVLNHPLWDLAEVGAAAHMSLLRQFLAEHRSQIHGLELNGFRSRRENGGVRTLGVESSLLLISGGDRHACAPNAIVNVTGAATFGDFADEVRAGISHIVIMPEYRRHLAARKLAAASEVLRSYRSYPLGQRRWLDRVSCEWRGSVRPLSYHWPTGGPLWIQSAIGTFRVLTSPIVLPVIRAALEAFDGSLPVSPLPMGTPADTSTGVFRLDMH